MDVFSIKIYLMEPKSPNSKSEENLPRDYAYGPPSKRQGRLHYLFICLFSCNYINPFRKTLEAAQQLKS